VVIPPVEAGLQRGALVSLPVLVAAATVDAVFKSVQNRSRADGIGETEGKAATGSGERAGKQVSFNRKSAIANS
jgi:hypothetical protein